MEIIFHFHANKTHFHKKGCAPSLILKVRVFGTRKWPIGMMKAETRDLTLEGMIFTMDIVNSVRNYNHMEGFLKDISTYKRREPRYFTLPPLPE